MNKHEEEYVERLEVIDCTEELEKACVNYEEQMARKLKFDSKLLFWPDHQFVLTNGVPCWPGWGTGCR